MYFQKSILIAHSIPSIFLFLTLYFTPEKYILQLYSETRGCDVLPVWESVVFFGDPPAGRWGYCACMIHGAENPIFSNIVLIT